MALFWPPRAPVSTWSSLIISRVLLLENVASSSCQSGLHDASLRPLTTRESNEVHVNIHADICYVYNIQSPREAVTDLVQHCAGKLAREKSHDLQHLLSLTVEMLSVQLI